MCFKCYSLKLVLDQELITTCLTMTWRKMYLIIDISHAWKYFDDGLTNDFFEEICYFFPVLLCSIAVLLLFIKIKSCLRCEAKMIMAALSFSVHGCSLGDWIYAALISVTVTPNYTNIDMKFMPIKDCVCLFYVFLFCLCVLLPAIRNHFMSNAVVI